MFTNLCKSGRFRLAGVWFGITVFALFGILQGYLIGKSVGLGVVGAVFNAQSGPSTSSVIALGFFIFMGITLTGVALIGSCFFLGWCADKAVELMRGQADAVSSPHNVSQMAARKRAGVHGMPGMEDVEITRKAA